MKPILFLLPLLALNLIIAARAQPYMPLNIDASTIIISTNGTKVVVFTSNQQIDLFSPLTFSDGSVQSEAFRKGGVTSDYIANQAVTSDKIADGAIIASKVAFPIVIAAGYTVNLGTGPTSVAYFGPWNTDPNQCRTFSQTEFSPGCCPTGSIPIMTGTTPGCSACSISQYFGQCILTND